MTFSKKLKNKLAKSLNKNNDMDSSVDMKPPIMKGIYKQYETNSLTFVALPGENAAKMCRRNIKYVSPIFYYQLEPYPENSRLVICTTLANNSKSIVNSVNIGVWLPDNNPLGWKLEIVLGSPNNLVLTAIPHKLDKDNIVSDVEFNGIAGGFPVRPEGNINQVPTVAYAKGKLLTTDITDYSVIPEDFPHSGNMCGKNVY